MVQFVSKPVNPYRRHPERSRFSGVAKDLPHYWLFA
jgi:hypothetical protein